MTPHAETAGVSGISIAIPLALLAVLSAALAVETGLVNIGRRDAALAAPEAVTIAPHEFEYRDATEYFRSGLAVDAPKRRASVRMPLTIMKYQTSLSEYGRCVADGACPEPEGRDTASGGDTPVTGVSYEDALRYAGWLSQQTGEDWRLPTDFELAYAADDRFPDDALGVDADSKNPALRWLADYEREARRTASSDPAPQPSDLGPLISADRPTRSRPLPPQRGHPVPQRLVIDTQLAGDVSHRPAGVDHQHRRLPAELFRVLADPPHPGPVLPGYCQVWRCRPPPGVASLRTGGPPKCARARPAQCGCQLRVPGCRS